MKIPKENINKEDSFLKLTKQRKLKQYNEMLDSCVVVVWRETALAFEQSTSDNMSNKKQ